jgi:hypothetical protein
MLDDLLGRYFEEPEGLVLTDVVWGILKDHLEFLAAQNDSLVLYI